MGSAKESPHGGPILTGPGPNPTESEAGRDEEANQPTGHLTEISPERVSVPASRTGSALRPCQVGCESKKAGQKHAVASCPEVAPPTVPMHPFR